VLVDEIADGGADQRDLAATLGGRYSGWLPKTAGWLSFHA